MRIQVELHKDVVRYIRHQCNREEAQSFYEQLERVRAEPISNSEAVAKPELSRYMLRFFRFRKNMAIFEYDVGRDQIRVLECEKPKPPRKESHRRGK